MIDPFNIGDAIEVTVTRASNPKTGIIVMVALLTIIVIYFIFKKE